jgi:hypothetical protein
MQNVNGPPPPNWRELVGQPKGTRRIEIVNEDGWTLVDNWRGETVAFETKKDAANARAFANHYIRAWGDINFASFPYSIQDAPVPREEE